MKIFGTTSVLKHALPAMTVLAALAVACSSLDNTYELSPDNADLTWRGDYDRANHHMIYTGEWAGCGWWFGDDSLKPAADFSEYDQLIVSVDNVVGDSVNLYLNARYTKTDVISSGTAPVVHGQATLRIDLDSCAKSHVLEVYVMSKSPCELTLKSAMLKKPTKYGKPRELKSEGGFIDASEFNGYSDNALISFNFYAEGDMTYIDESGNLANMNNWGIGYVRSCADLSESTYPGRSIILKKIGEQSYQCYLGDIRYMLGLKDNSGRYGLCWMVWSGGNLTDVHTINATICEAKKR